MKLLWWRRHTEYVKKTWVLTVTVVILVLSEVPLAQGALKRCYTCRSRGDLGTCKDPFPINGTVAPWAEGVEPQLLRGVESVPCSSGWCGKMLEGGSTFKDDDYGIATQRLCLQRAPSDGEERCAYIQRNGRKVFACFCQGDLCNSAITSLPSLLLPVLLVLITRLT